MFHALQKDAPLLKQSTDFSTNLSLLRTSHLIVTFIRVKGDGVDLRRFSCHLFVVMKSHATSGQNRYPGCLASYHIICRGIDRQNIFKTVPIEIRR